MDRKHREGIVRGSRRWVFNLAETAAWLTVVLVLGLVAMAGLEDDERLLGYGLAAGQAVWVVLFFRVVFRGADRAPWLEWLAIAVSVALAAGGYALLAEEVPTAELLFVPVLLVTGLVASLPQVVVATVVALGAYVGLAETANRRPPAADLTLHAVLFVLAGVVAAMLARELRSHFQGERKEHRLATAVRHRLLAVLDAVDEGIVFSDTDGVVRVVNRRAGELFELTPDDHLGLPLVQLLRTMALQMEDPEEFMESFQQIRGDAEGEIRINMEQIIPTRRRLRIYSGPAFDESGDLVGRIDVFTDETESVRRAAEIERLYEEARKTAESYQRSLLPGSVPKLPRVSMVAHYIPAAGRRAVCGDFYDFVPLRDGRIAVVLGDVCGIGPAAANDAAFTRYTLRSFASEESDLGSLIERMNTHVSVHLSADRFVRLLCGVLDPERAVFELSNAGHVPPLLYHAGSATVEWLGDGGVALGIDDDAYKVGRVEFEPGDMLVMYTDGVTEASRAGKPLGQARLEDIVLEYGVGTPGELVQAIRRAVESWVGTDELRDDIALLVCQVVPDAVVGEPTRELVLPNEASRVAEVRHFVAAYLADVRAPVDVSSEILLAVSEAAGNSCRHGRRADGRSEVRVRCSLAGASVRVTVADDGPGFDLNEIDARSVPDRFASGGRGLFLMRELMDAVDIATGDDGTVVTLSRAIPALPGSGRRDN